jgi:PAS domain S-box-containing protein
VDAPSFKKISMKKKTSRRPSRKSASRPNTLGDKIGRKTKTDNALRLYAERLEQAEKHARLGSWEFDVSTGQGWWSKQMYRMLGFEESNTVPGFEEYLAHIHPEDRALVQDVLVGMSGGKEPTPREFRSNPDLGPTRYFTPTLSVERDREGNPVKFRGTLHDNTERNRAEMEIARVNRVLRMFSATNQALIHSTEEEGLLKEACRIAVDVGGYRMAWVGFAEHDESKTLRPVAYAGIEPGSIESARLTWADDEYGRGPGGAAIRTGLPYLARNIQIEPAYAPWREAAIQHGYRAALALPLTSEGLTLGTLDIYSGEENSFDAAEVDILKELADDLAFGLSTLRRRKRQVQAEQALRESEERYRLIAENTAETIAVLDLRLHSTYVSPSVLKLRGYAVQEAIAQSLDQILTPASLLKANNAFAEQMALESSGTADPWRTVFLELEEYCRDGSTIWVELSASFLRDNDLTPTGILTVTRDITERRHAEVQLRKLSLAVEQSPVSVIMTNTDGEIEYVNPKFMDITGYTRDEVLGKNPRILRSDDARPEVYRQLWETIKGGREWRGEFHNKKKNGELFWESASISPVRDESGIISHFVAIKEDITERKRAEEELRQYETKRLQLERQLIQAQKLESLGTLASGVAHDFNNILSIILGRSTLLERDLSNPAKASKNLAAILKATERGALIVRQLLTFARKGEPVFASVSINDIVNEVVNLLGETIPKTITVFTDLKPGVPAIVADATGIHQVLLNLCVNARDAMPEGGNLTITTTIMDNESVVPQFPGATSGEYVLVRVTDTGTGMDEETKQRIFDPFFTTKGPGKGTGLGLAVAYSIVEEHDGMIAVESAPGKGTTFSLFFPIEEHPAMSGEVSAHHIDDIPGGRETVLLIEDEEMLADLVKSVLDASGYTVLTARDGAEGLMMFERHQDQIAVVLSDIGLPKYGGDEVFKRIKLMDPKARVILASGFVEPRVKSELLEAGLERFIQKPYSPSEVLHAIRAAIDGAG